MNLRVVTAGVLGLLLCPPIAAVGVKGLGQIRVDEILVVRSTRALDIPDPAMVNPVLGIVALGLIPGLVSSAVADNRRKRVHVRQLETLRPLSEEPQIEQFVERLRAQVMEVVATRHGTADARVQRLDSEAARRLLSLSWRRSRC